MIGIFMHVLQDETSDTVPGELLANPFPHRFLTFFLSFYSNRAVSWDCKPSDCHFEHQTGPEAPHEEQTQSVGESLSSPVGQTDRLNNSIEMIWEEPVATESDRLESADYVSGPIELLLVYFDVFTDPTLWLIGDRLCLILFCFDCLTDKSVVCLRLMCLRMLSLRLNKICVDCKD